MTVQVLSFTKPGPSHTEFLVLCSPVEYLPRLLNPALNYIYCFGTVIHSGIVAIAVCRKLKKGRDSTKLNTVIKCGASQYILVLADGTWKDFAS